MSNSNKPTLKSTEIHNTPSIIDKNVSLSRVHEPHWVNNITRLNETNVNLMRANLIKYIDLVVEALFKDVKTDINTLIKNSAGWVQFHTENDVTNAIGEIFNLVDGSVESSQDNWNSNVLSTNHKYQAAFGRLTIANGEAQFVCGKYNDPETDALFIVGCGDDKLSRSNAIVIGKSGQISILKDITFSNTVNFDNNTKVVFQSRPEFNNGADFSQDVYFNHDVIFWDGFTTIAETTSTINGRLIVESTPKSKKDVVRKKELDDLRSEISGALHYIGKTTTELTDGDTTNPIPIYDAECGEFKDTKAAAGDVVIINGTQNEFIFDGKSWTDYSAYANYVVTKIYEEQQQKLHKALFSNSNGETPNWSDTNTSPDAKSLQTQLQNKIQESNETLALAISELSDTIDDFHSNYFIFDGGGAQEADPDGDWN